MTSLDAATGTHSAAAPDDGTARHAPRYDIAIVAVVAALITVAVFLLRGLGDAEHNWPISYELSSSDNGVLFQLASDLFAGRPLDWSFSPQTYTFPELPISLVAYALAFGNLYAYYVIVAALNQAIFAAILAALVRALFPRSTRRERFLRAGIAVTPLVVLPLVADNTLYLFHLAPTYYIGVYLLAFALPLALLTRRRAVRIAVLAAYALTAASNPLLAAMTLPSAAIALVVLFLRDGLRGLATRVTIWLGVTVAVTVVLRAPLSRFAATDPTSYISVSRAAGRIRAIRDVLQLGLTRDLDPALFTLSITAAVVCLLGAALALRRFIARALRPETTADAARDTRRSVVLAYLTTLPVLGVVAMYLILAVHQYYLWLLIVGSIVVAAIVLPRGRALTPVAVAAGLALVGGFGWVGARTIGDPQAMSYLGYRAPLTKCLDANLPADALGYATFSDARHYGLPSDKGIRLIAVGDTIGPSYWLANRAPARTEVGSFVLVNPHTDEAGFTTTTLEQAFGAPERVVACEGGDGAQLWVYGESSKQRIADFYRRTAG